MNRYLVALHLAMTVAWLLTILPAKTISGIDSLRHHCLSSMFTCPEHPTAY